MRAPRAPRLRLGVLLRVPKPLSVAASQQSNRREDGQSKTNLLAFGVNRHLWVLLNERW
jgi:hypothetical protein